MNGPQKPTDDAKEETPGEPWTIEAELIADARKISTKDAVDLVIVRYLRTGDTRALAWWLYEGHTMSERARKFIAVMLQPGSKATTEAVPFELAAKTRTPKRGRPKKGPEPSLRDWLLFRFIYNFMQDRGPGQYDAAITELAELQGIERATIKRAYENTKKILALPTEEN
jgi:hypothetical protein